jgi:hypothetical protein
MAYPNQITGTNVTANNLPYRTDTAAALSGPLSGTSKLWLPVWSGEVIQAYDQYNVFENLVESRTISSGLAAEFPITGTVSIKGTWEAGEELVGGADAASNTIAIKLDKRPMAAHFELDNVDLMITQWEYRAELARQAGLALANARDKQVGAYIARAGVEDLTWSGSTTAGSQDTTLDPRGVNTGPVFLQPKFTHLGNSTSSASNRTDAALLALKAIEDFFVYLQEINAPTDGVVMVVTPRAFQDIRALGIARDNTGLSSGAGRPFFGGVAEAGGLGSQLTMGMNSYTDSLEYMGAKIIKSSHIPNVNYTNIGESRYNLAFADSGVKAMIFQKSCIGTLSLMGMKVDTVEDVRRNTTFTVASMMKGTGVLRPECCGLLVAPTASNTGTYAKGSGYLFSDSSTVATAVDAAGEGGAEASLARNELRVLLGANFSREFIGTSATGFPYA